MNDRLAPEIAFPAYAFVPGQHPHPVTDPRGHSFHRPQVNVDTLDPLRPGNSHEYLYAIDLFNAGYYWEAHESWEELWAKAGRTGIVADFLKGLIKLAAAGVKSREGSVTGVQRHAKRAFDLFKMIDSQEGSHRPQFAGLTISELVDAAKNLLEHPIVDETPTKTGRPVLPVRLTFVTVASNS